MKYVWKCLNEKCERYDKVYVPGSCTMKYDGRRRRLYPTLNDSEKYCPCCGLELQPVLVHSQIQPFGIGTFKGKSDEEKKNILKQRYDRGMVQGGRDEVEMRKRDAIGKMIGYDK